MKMILWIIASPAKARLGRGECRADVRSVTGVVSLGDGDVPRYGRDGHVPLVIDRLGVTDPRRSTAEVGVDPVVDLIGTPVTSTPAKVKEKAGSVVPETVPVCCAITVPSLAWTTATAME